MSKVFLLSLHLHAFSVCSWTRASGSEEGWAFGTSRGAASHLPVSGWDLEPHGERSAEGDLEAVEVVGGGARGGEVRPPLTHCRVRLVWKLQSSRFACPVFLQVVLPISMSSMNFRPFTI